LVRPEPETAKRTPVQQEQGPVAVQDTPGFIPADPNDPHGRDRGSKLYRELHPLRIRKGDFDGLDFAFSLTEPIGEYDTKEIRRIVFFHWRAAAKKYWSTPAAKIHSPDRFEAMLSMMAEQVPGDYRMPGEVTSQIPIWPSDCPSCEGRGNVITDHPSLNYRPGIFQASIQCGCVQSHPYPWRLISANRDN
jgi:hypothetical protein